MNDQSKVTADHLRRDAYLYVRQSSLYQVANNTESSRRQYDLRGRAVALGWPADSVIVIDVDQGQSGASAADRAGFQRLVADVSLGKAGIVLGLECSRLARNNADWHRLLELCSLSGTLICDEDGLYDPGSINDRLLLGLKGTISEAELHFIRARLQGGLLAKAARGELRVRLPVGLAYDQLGNVTLDPDAERARGDRVPVPLLRADRLGARGRQAVRRRRTHVPRPARLGGPHAGELYWKPLRHDLVLFTLHNPRYAGAYFYGRRKQLTDIDGHTRTVLKPRDQWTVLIHDAHPGYITFEQYERNQQTLAANAAAHSGEERRAGPAREGPALLQGLVVCGKCGKRMTVSYHTALQRRAACPTTTARARGSRPAPRHARRSAAPASTHAVAKLVLEQLTPLAIETALAVSTELAAARRRRRPDPPDGRQARRARRRGRPPPLPRRGPDQPARRRPARSRLEQQAARARRRPRRVRARHPGRQPAAHRRAASPDPRARDRPTRALDATRRPRCANANG